MPARLSHYSVGAAAVMLAACGGQPPIAQSFANLARSTHATARSQSSSYDILYRFPKSAGNEEKRALIEFHGKLYGTTWNGGSAHLGSFYSLSLSGVEQTLYSFSGGSADGEHPAAQLLRVGGVLYGTIAGGGACGQGTIYSIGTHGAEKVLHSFCGTDGTSPFSELTDVNGTLFGVAYFGGTAKYGTAFSVSAAGTFDVLHAFGGTALDARNPNSALVEVDGILYGTSGTGGTDTACGKFTGNSGCGTVYSMTQSGAVAILHSFQYGSGGWYPDGLLAAGGTLYGATYFGGNSKSFCCGTFFKLAPASGDYTELFKFIRNGSDGISPDGSFVRIGGTLYDTTAEGGVYRKGTLYGITLGGAEQVLHSFGGPLDGTEPNALIGVDGTLYGTTANGGATRQRCNESGKGCGLVYSLVP